MEIHRTLGDKVRIYRRVDGGAWHCSTYLKGREWRKSTKERSLARAKDIAEDWYLELCGKDRHGELRSGKTFAQAARSSKRNTRPSRMATAAPNGCRATRTASAFIYCPTSARRSSPRSHPAPRRNTACTG